MKKGLEDEFIEAVDSRDNQISNLTKSIANMREEYDQLLKTNKELENQVQRLAMNAKSLDSPPIKAVKNGDHIDTQASNEDEFAKRFEDHFADAESDSDHGDFFNDPGNYTITLRNQGTSENLAELMGMRTSYHGELFEEAYDLLHKSGGSKKNIDNDLVRLVDVGTQTKDDTKGMFKLNLQPIEEEKYNTSLQDYSVDLDLNESKRYNNESISASQLLSPRARKDALEEYFRMSVLAAKIAHQDLDKVCHIKSSKLYEKAKIQGVSFQDYNSWIEQQLNKMFLDTKYQGQNRRGNYSKGNSLTGTNNELFAEPLTLSKSKSHQSDRDQLREYINTDKGMKQSKRYMFLDDEDFGQNKQKEKCTIF